MNTVQVDLDFIVYLREKYAMQRYPTKEDLKILDYCEGIITKFHCNRAAKQFYAQGDEASYNEIKTIKPNPKWG